MPPPDSPALPFAAADRNVRLFVAFRILFNARFYYPVFMVMFLDFGITVEAFALLNAVWAAAIVLLEVPSGALADLIGRRRLVVAGAALMVIEMLLLVLVPVPSAWVLPALVANRILSGAAEAFISGADEALAFDSLAVAGRAADWPKVLERLMRVGGVVTIVCMVTGSLVYDPGPLDALARGVGVSGGLSRAATFRLPIWLTLGSALAALAAAMAMRGPVGDVSPDRGHRSLDRHPAAGAAGDRGGSADRHADPAGARRVERTLPADRHPGPGIRTGERGRGAARAGAGGAAAAVGARRER
jgi:MFS family permease